MRAFREIIGGLVLAILAACTVLGGLWLAVTENGLGFLQSTPTSIAALTNVPSPTAFVPSATSSKAVTAIASIATATATSTPTHTASPIPPTFTATVPASATASATLALTNTPLPTDTPIQITSSPTPCGPPFAWVQYIVAPGDTLFQLSLRYGVSQQQLKTANCLPTTEIKYGQVLYVPFAASATPQASATSLPTATATPVADPLRVNGVTLVSVQTDSSRPNGAIATLYVNVSGGAAPYTIYNDNAPQAGNPFTVLTECGGTLLHTLRVLSTDGQTVEYPYYYSPVNCS